MEPKKMTSMTACRDFFGLHPNQTGLEFGKEIKALTPKDREEITDGLKQNGYAIMDAAGKEV